MSRSTSFSLCRPARRTFCPGSISCRFPAKADGRTLVGSGSTDLWWQLTALANAVILAAYLAISFAIGRGLWQSRQWRNNPLGLATAAIFFSCAVHHGSHTVHLLLPYLGRVMHTGMAMRHAFGTSF